MSSNYSSIQPMESLALWRSPLARALHRNRSLPYARYVQLATVRANGQPANRTIVFRGFAAQGNQLQFVTDARSAKVESMERSKQETAWGELCWYFPKTREQFRLLGQLTLVTQDTPDPTRQRDRQQQWQALSDAARTQFGWPAPGQPRSPTAAFAVASPDPMRPPASFCLLLLDPVEVDHLELRGEPQNRYRYTIQPDSSGEWQWQVMAINP